MGLRKVELFCSGPRPITKIENFSFSWFSKIILKVCLNVSKLTDIIQGLHGSFVSRKYWDKVSESEWLELELVLATKKVIYKVRAEMCTIQNWQKSYVDIRYRNLKFKIVSMKDFLRSKHECKLSSHFLKCFETLERIGSVAYWLDLSSSISISYNVFHMSMHRLSNKLIPCGRT